MKKVCSLILLLIIGFATQAQIRIIEVEPSSNTIIIKNFGGSTVDISTYRLCALFKYTSNLTSGITVNSGSMNLTAGSEVEFIAPGGASSSWGNLTSNSDLGLYEASGSFGSTTAMIDFVQWGSGGHGRESVANSKGIWTSGEFVSGDEPYSYIGNGSENGASFWEGLVSNSAPTDISLDNSSVNENLTIGTTVGNLSSTDSDGADTHTYTLVAGAGDTDNSSFDISSTTLITNGIFNHEMKDTYSIRIQTDDGNGGIFPKEFVINIEDINDDPTAMSLSNQTVVENQSIGTLVGSFETTDEDDGDSHDYSFVSGSGDTDNSSFSIDGSALETNEVFDFSVKTSYSIRIRSDDNNGGIVESSFSITITEDTGNLAPSDITLSNKVTLENQPASTIVGILTSADVNVGDNHTYSLVSGTGDTNNGSFQISGDELLTAEPLNFEQLETNSVRIQTNDGNGGVFQKAFSIAVSDENDAPILIEISSSNTSENQGVGSIILTLNTSDEDSQDTHSYSLVSGEGDVNNDSFSISGNTVLSSQVFNFEAKEAYLIRLRTEDNNGAEFEDAFVVNITNENDAPSQIELALNTLTTSSPIGTLVGCLGVIDEDATDTHTYSFVEGIGSDDNDLFDIQNADIMTDVDLNGISNSPLTIRVGVTDLVGASVETVFEVPITIISITSVPKLYENGGINIYPNPFNDLLSIEFPIGLDEVDVLIYSLNGSLVYQSNDLQQTANKVMINSSELKPGLYHLKLVSGQSTVFSSLVVKE